MAPGGWLVWHDFNSPVAWVKVREAIERAEFAEVVVHVEGTEVAFLRKGDREGVFSVSRASGDENNGAVSVDTSVGSTPQVGCENLFPPCKGGIQGGGGAEGTEQATASVSPPLPPLCKGGKNRSLGEGGIVDNLVPLAKGGYRGVVQAGGRQAVAGVSPPLPPLRKGGKEQGALREGGRTGSLWKGD